MKTKNSGIVFGGGAIFGLALALCLGAEQKPRAGQTNQTPVKEIFTPPPPDRSRLQIVAYPNGTTGIFEPESGTIYVYDANLSRCYLIRQIMNLGAPLRQL